MALDVTPVNRNLHTRVTFMALEFEDLFVVQGLAAVMNVVSRFVSGQLSADLFAILAVAVVMNVLGRFLNREMFGLPMNMVLQYIVPILTIPALMLFKYGKPRGYLRDLLNWYTRPKAYCAVAHDRHMRSSYVKVEQ